MTEIDYKTTLRKLLDMIAKPVGCEKCDRLIWFVPTKSGKRAPITSEGIVHGADCPGAADFRKREHE